MELFEAIFGRHSVSKVKPDPIPREMIEKLLSAAVQAPNHHRVRPWRFVVVTGDGRKKLGDVFAASFAERNPAAPVAAREKPRGLPLRAPVLIALGVDKPTESKVSEIENIVATGAAGENILLAAYAMGLGVQWRTGEWALDPRVKEFLGFASDQHVIGFLYVGYPEFVAEYPPRPGYEDQVRWIE